MKPLTHASLFSGIGGFDLAAEWAGWTNLFNCEKDPFCQRVLKYHFPDAKQYSDICTTDFSVWRGHIDVLTGGFPCFTEDTYILSENGYKKIKDITLGEKVLTDMGRFKPVNALMNRKTKDTVSIKSQGIASPLITTINHPFWVKKKTHPFARRYGDRYADPEWINADKIHKGDLIAYRCIDGTDEYKTPEFWYMVGRYLGDGWILDGKRTSKIPQGKRGSRVTSKNWKVVICCKKEEKPQLEKAISEAGYSSTISEDRTTYKFIISSQELTKFLSQFGRYSYGKKLSGKCFHLAETYKKALFNGWLDADGYIEKNGAYKITTVSEELVYGMAQIARDCFRTPVTISKKTVNRECVIEGRKVSERPQFCLTVSNSSRYGYYEDGFVWSLVKEVCLLNQEKEVFNIGVYHDETYTANGITVHNCQPFSTAGKRKGTADDRYLWPEMLRAIREIRPRWVVGENVRGIVNWSGGLVFEQVCADLENEGYEVASYLVPACGVGAPHRRDRVWFIAHAKGDGDSGGSATFCKANGRQNGCLFSEPLHPSDLWITQDTDRIRCDSDQCEEESRAGGFGQSGAGGHGRVCAEARTVAHCTDTGIEDVQSGGQDGISAVEPPADAYGVIRKSRRPESTGQLRPAGTANGCDVDAADTASCGRVQNNKGQHAGQLTQDIPNWQDFPTQPPVCGGNDGLPAQLDGITFPKWRAESIKAYGNAVVPQVVYQVFKAINEYEWIVK